MPEKPLPASVLAALGLVGATTACPCLKMSPCLDYAHSGDTDVGPCLSVEPPETGETGETGDTADTSETGETGDTGDTSDTADTADTQDTVDTGVGPCLDYAPRPSARRPARAEECPVPLPPPDPECPDPLASVLERQVLPEDVAARLRARRERR